VTDNKQPIVSAKLAIEAMRDNGYKNTATAVAELIDNSIQAGGSKIELLIMEKIEYAMANPKARVNEIAVLDDGHGMDATVLVAAMQFGNGTRLNDRSGMGRFGMGLPASSISQARRVDVWSWKKPGEVLHTYLDIDDLGEGLVPTPSKSEIPDRWKKASQGIGKSGTLIVWSKLDRCVWKTAEALIRNSEFVIGRMYRKFIFDGKVVIRMCAFSDTAPTTKTIDQFAQANDPGYLLAPSSTPAPYDQSPLFNQWGANYEVPYTVDFDNEKHVVMVRYSLVKPEARKVAEGSVAAGATEYGKHAKRNLGVSLVRAGRELVLDQNLVNSYDPTERWWGVEIEFPPSLDVIFGVTNNKQEARNFASVAELIAGESFDGSLQQEIERLKESGDPTVALYTIIHAVKNQLSTMRKQLKANAPKAPGAKKRYEAEETATAVTKKRQDDNHAGSSDAGELEDEAARKTALIADLTEAGVGAIPAEELVSKVIESGIKYIFVPADLEGSIFFSVRPVAGEIVIKINNNHAAFDKLLSVLEEPVGDDVTAGELANRLSKASDGLKLLLMSWARYEDEAGNALKTQLQDMRTDWGRIAAEFLKEA
jgi:hypothetical protein